MRLLHVDSDELVLIGLRRAAPKSWVVTSILLTQDAPPEVTEGAWDVCLIGVGDGAARDALHWLAQLHHAGCPMLAWVAHGAVDYIPAMKALDVVGYVLRSASFDEVRAAIVRAVAGEGFVDHGPQDGLQSVSGLADLGLSPTQERVAALYVLYGSRRMVAQELHVSENTVKYHLQQVYRKTHTSSLHSLYELLRARGWAPSEAGLAPWPARQDSARAPRSE